MRILVGSMQVQEPVHIGSMGSRDSLTSIACRGWTLHLLTFLGFFWLKLTCTNTCIYAYIYMAQYSYLLPHVYMTLGHWSMSSWCK